MLWKHHAAQRYANRMTEIAEARGEAFLPRYGGRISSGVDAAAALADPQ